MEGDAMTDLHTAAREAIRAAIIGTREYVLGFCSKHLPAETFDRLRRADVEASMVQAITDSESVRAALDAGQAQPVGSAHWEPVARVVTCGATVRLEWASVAAAHNAKPGLLFYTAPQASQSVALDLREAYALACDLVCWINADETVMGDPARTYDTAVKLRDCLGKMPGGAQPVATAGWQWVPVEPTQAMLDAMQSGGWMPGNYRAMLSAAPPAPAAHPLTADDSADARRYRWLRDHAVQELQFDHTAHTCDIGILVPCEWHDDPSLDEAIDAAIGAQP